VGSPLSSFGVTAPVSRVEGRQSGGQSIIASGAIRVREDPAPDYSRLSLGTAFSIRSGSRARC
jgi:hypothetical protein